MGKDHAEYHPRGSRDTVENIENASAVVEKGKKKSAAVALAQREGCCRDARRKDEEEEKFWVVDAVDILQRRRDAREKEKVRRTFLHIKHLRVCSRRRSPPHGYAIAIGNDALGKAVSFAVNKGGDGGGELKEILPDENIGERCEPGEAERVYLHEGENARVDRASIAEIYRGKACGRAREKVFYEPAPRDAEYKLFHQYALDGRVEGVERGGGPIGQRNNEEFVEPYGFPQDHRWRWQDTPEGGD